MLITISLGLLLGLLFASLKSSATLESILNDIIQYPGTNTQLYTALYLQYHDELLRNLSFHIPAAGAHLEIRAFALRMKYKFIFLLAWTNISVIIPTYNEEKYLPRCLRSLANQSWNGPFEVIVVDGGSTDGTVAIARKYANKVRVEHGLPVGAARNLGAKQAEGDILAFIDADTVASNGWLREIARFFDSNPYAVGVTGPTLPYDGGTIDSIIYRFWTIYLQRILLSTGMPHVIGFNCAYRKEPFLMAGGFDETAVMSEDILLAQKMRQFGKIVFDKRMYALTSARRFQQCGHAYITGLYLLNGFSTLLLKKSSRHYPPVR